MGNFTKKMNKKNNVFEFNFNNAPFAIKLNFFMGFAETETPIKYVRDFRNGRKNLFAIPIELMNKSENEVAKAMGFSKDEVSYINLTFEQYATNNPYVARFLNGPSAASDVEVTMFMNYLHRKYNVA